MRVLLATLCLILVLSQVLAFGGNGRCQGIGQRCSRSGRMRCCSQLYCDNQYGVMTCKRRGGGGGGGGGWPGNGGNGGGWGGNGGGWGGNGGNGGNGGSNNCVRYNQRCQRNGRRRCCRGMRCNNGRCR